MQPGVMGAPHSTMHQIQFGAVPGPSQAPGAAGGALNAIQHQHQHHQQQHGGGSGVGRPDGGNAGGAPLHSDAEQDTAGAGS